MEYIAYMDSVTNGTVPCLFFIHATQKREVKISMKEEKFDYPTCLYTENKFYKLNRFPLHPMLQTFLLDKDNRIIAMGDPVTNPKVKELYLNIINGKRNKKEQEQMRTEAEISTSTIDFGSFHWEEQKDTIVTFINKGKKPLVIHDIVTSCGCTVADYDKRPARSGESVKVKISFKADYPERFNKTVGIYCNTKESPYVVRVMGEAKKKLEVKVNNDVFLDQHTCKTFIINSSKPSKHSHKKLQWYLLPPLYNLPINNGACGTIEAHINLIDFTSTRQNVYNLLTYSVIDNLLLKHKQ